MTKGIWWISLLFLVFQFALGREIEYQLYLNVGDDLSQGLRDSLDKGGVIQIYLNAGKWGNETQFIVSQSLGWYQELFIIGNGTVDLNNYSFQFEGNRSSVTFTNINFNGETLITALHSSLFIDSIQMNGKGNISMEGPYSSIFNSSFNSSSIHLNSSDFSLEGNRFKSSQLSLLSNSSSLEKNQFDPSCVVNLNSKDTSLLGNIFGERDPNGFGKLNLGSRIESLYSVSNSQMGLAHKLLSPSSFTIQNVTMRNCSLKSFDLEGEFSRLKYLDISGNNFSDKFPNLLAVKNLNNLNVSRCQLSVALNDSFPSEFPLLEHLDISNNLLQDTSPSGFLSSNSLRTIDFSNNQYHFAGNFTSFGLFSCSASGNPFFCPIEWKTYNFCKVQCYNDHLIESFRIGYDGRRNSTSARYLASKIAIIANISLSRVNVTREKNQIDADVDILPIKPEDHNQPNSYQVVIYLNNLNYSVWAKYGVKGVSDFIFPIPPDRTFSNPIVSGSNAIVRGYSDENAIAAIGITLLVIAVLFIVIVLVILYLKKKNQIKRDTALSSSTGDIEMDGNENENVNHKIVELEDQQQ